jgi:5-methylcytosine-specific restriction endonuclease McrA
MKDKSVSVEYRVELIEQIRSLKSKRVSELDLQLENRIYNCYQRLRESGDTKKEIIIILKAEFGDLDNTTISHILDCSTNYVQSVKVEDVQHGEATGYFETRTSSETKLAVDDRDGQKCVSCCASDKLEYHHIRPISKGGKDISENVATVCSVCHNWFHGGNANTKETIYSSVSEFWDMADR